MIDNKTKFRPVVGKEAKLKTLPHNEGYVYYASDTGKIFLDVDGERVTMGGSGASLFYFEENNVAELPNGAYQLNLANMADGQDPSAIKENDLIINTTTGSFYRVFSVDQDANTVEAELLAVSGGGSGGGGGGGGGEVSTSIKIDVLDPPANTYVYGQDAYTTVIVTASDDTYVYLTLDIIGAQGTTTKTDIVQSGVEVRLNIGKALQAGINKIVIRASGDNSGTASPKSYPNRQAIRLGLQASSSFNPLAVQNGTATIQYRPEGLIEKTMTVYVDNIQVASKTIHASISGITDSIDVPEQAHGVHKVLLVLSAELNGLTVSTEPLEYELAWAQSGNLNPIIWFPYGYETNIVNYSNYLLQYRVYDPSNNETTTMHIRHDGVEINTSPLTVPSDINATSAQTLSISDYNVGSNSYVFVVGSTSKEILFEVSEDMSRDLNVLQSGLIVNLDSRGRSNAENPQSREIWTSVRDGKTAAVQFNNFNWYNNGWIMDENGDSCLRISNGASITIPLGEFDILRSTQLNTSLAFEFRFKIRNVREYATLITRQATDTSDPNYEEDPNKAIYNVSNFETERGVVGKFYGTKGILIGTQEALFSTGESTISARYKEDDIVSLTFVLERRTATRTRPLIYIYINGVASGVCTYTSSESFEAQVSNMIFDSTYADIDLYNVRIYNIDFSSADVVHNYIADIKNVDIYDVNNNIITYENNLPMIDYTKMLEYNQAHPSTPIEPYAVIKVRRDSDKMPYFKGDKVPVDIKFVNPYLDYLWENRDSGAVNPLTGNPITEEEYLTGCPSFNYVTTDAGVTYAINGVKGQLNVQGTSSQGYPRRNFKWKASLKDKQKNQLSEWTYTNGPLKDQSLWDKNTINDKSYKNWYMDTTLTGSSVFTFKADYMESSSSHNTGMANYVGTLYSKHPLEYYDNLNVSVNVSLLRTTIYGFPMLVFQEKQDGTYEYLGRYNFNLDKDSNERFGFEVDGDSLVRDPEDDTKFLPIKKVAECWEFEHNGGGRCSAKKTDWDEIDSDPQKNGALSLMSDFDYRYNYYADDIDDMMDGAGDWENATQAEKNAYWLERTTNLRDVLDWLTSTDTSVQGLTEEQKNERLTKFRNEFSSHFNKEYCTVYFIATELLHMYDSRGKNMMWATWGPQVEGGDYIWFPIFYDMDTMFGINNSGIPTWDYNAEPTDLGQFSTNDNTLWENFYACYEDDIQSAYRTLVGSRISYEQLAGYFNFDPTVTKSLAMEGQRPIVTINVDEYYKYIAPAFSGFIDQEGNTSYTQTFFYCLQGTRELQRKLYFRNRLNYLNSKWFAGTYTTGGVKSQYHARFNANNAAETSDKYIYDTSQPAGTEVELKGRTFITSDVYPANDLDADLTLNIRTFLKQYVSGQFDDTKTEREYSDGLHVQSVSPPSGRISSIQSDAMKDESLYYIGGGEYIADLGDVSKHYPNLFEISPLIRLEEINIGSDVEGYYNDRMTFDNFKLDDSADSENPKSLLKKVNMTGLRRLSGPVDLGGSEKLEEFRALNTGVTSGTFAPGVQLHTLHLPITTNRLELVEASALTTLLSVPKVNGEIQRGLYIEGLTNQIGNITVNATRMNTYSLIGGALGYNSYKLLEVLTIIKQRMQNAETLAAGLDKVLRINLQNVNWSPYRQVSNGEIYISTNQYHKDNGRYKLIPYTYNAETWDDDVLNGRIYQYTPSVYEPTVVTDLNILDIYIQSYLDAVEYFNEEHLLTLNYFRNTSSTASTPTLPTITGLVYVNNSTAISEADLFNKYEKYFPDLKIFCLNVQEEYVTNYINIDETGKRDIFLKQCIKTTDSLTFGPKYPEEDPTKINYDFQGWATTPNGTPLTREEIEALRYTSQSTYNFYSIWDVQKFTITFKDPDTDDTIIAYEALYGEMLHEPLVLPVSNRENQLPDEQRYKCIGWVLNKDNSYPITINSARVNLLNLSAIMSQNNDRTYYACFLAEDCRTNPTEDKYFKFLRVEGGYNCSPAVSNAISLSGKITIPATYNSLPIVSLSGFGYNSNSGAIAQPITHIYWYGNPINFRTISSNCFTDCTSLRIFDMPNSIENIGAYAFQRCNKLQPIDFSTKTRLKMIDSYAFNQAFVQTQSAIILHFSGTTNIFGDMSFSYIQGTMPAGGTLQFGDEGDPVNFNSGVGYVGQNAFQENGNVLFTQIVFYYDPSVTTEEALSSILPQIAKGSSVSPTFIPTTKAV